MDHPAHLLKCGLKVTAVAALLFVCVLTSPVSRRVPKSVLIESSSLIQKKITTLLKNYADPGLFSNNSCSSLNETELAGFDEQPLSAQNLSLFRCYMMNVSLVTIEVTPLVQEISQYCEAAAAQMPGYVGPVSCSPPPFEEVEDAFTFVRCLLMLLNQLLSKHKL